MYSESTWMLLVGTGFMTMLGVVALGYLMYQVVQSQARTERLGISTHMLVNSAMGSQLRLTAETARSKADITHDPLDLTAAAIAERLLKEHQEKQQRADEWQISVSGGKAAVG